jgi:hypothetical protein
VREHSQAPQPPPIGNSPAGASIPIQLPPRLPPSRAGREHSQAPQPPPELIRNVTSTAQGPLDPPQVPLQPHNEKDLSIKLPQTSHPLVDREHSQQPQVLHHEHFRTPDPHADLGAQHPAEHHQGRLDRETAGDVAVVETADLRSGTASSENVDILSTVGEPSATQAVENIEFSSPIRREEDAEEAPSVIEHTSTNDGNIVEDGHRVPGEVGNLQVAVTNQHPGEREDVALTSLDGATNNTDSVPLDHMQIDEENLGNGRTDIRPSSRTSPETAPEAPEPSALPPKPKTKKKKMSKDRRNAIMQGLPRAATIFKEIAADTDSTYQEVLGVFAESEKDFVVRGENAWNLYETFFNDEQYKPNQIKVTRQKLSLGNGKFYNVCVFT